MILEAFDVTSGPFVPNPEQGCRVVGKANAEANGLPPIGIEFYPFHANWDFNVPADLMRLAKPLPLFNRYIPEPITTKKVLEWQNRYDAKAVRIHLPWFYNARDGWDQLLRGGHYPSTVHAIKDAGLMLAMGPLTNWHGVNLAHELNIGASAHPNSIAGLVKENKLDWLKSMVPVVYGENSVSYRSRLQPNREVLGDPRQTVRHDVIGHGLKFFVLAEDHMFGLAKNTDQAFIDQKIDYIAEVLEDEPIKKTTKVAHIALPNHGIIQVGDRNMERLLIIHAQSKLELPVRMTLDIEPFEMMEKTEAEQVRYLVEMREWSFNVINRYN